MKIRSGFVSNSSSSSFIIIIGDRLSCKELLQQAKELISKGRLYAEDGDDDGEGADFFPVTEEMWKSYNEYGPKNFIYFYDVQCVIEEPGIIEKDKIKGNKFNVFSKEISHHVCETLENFQERHIDMPGDSVPEEIVEKAKQIKRLQTEIKNSGYDIEILQNRELKNEN